MSKTNKRMALQCLFSCLISACVQMPSRPLVENASIEVNWRDVPTKMEFEVTLHSNEQVPICVSNEVWPTADGIFTGVDRPASVVVNGETFFAVPAWTSQCRSKHCYHIVPPAGELHGIISYSQFPSAHLNVNDDKQLSFEPHAFKGAACEQSN